MNRSKSSVYDPINSIEMQGEFYRNLKDLPLWVRLPFSLIFLIAPFVLLEYIIIPQSVKNYGKPDFIYGLILASCFLLPIILGVVIIIGRRKAR